MAKFDGRTGVYERIPSTYGRRGSAIQPASEDSTTAKALKRDYILNAATSQFGLARFWRCRKQQTRQYLCLVVNIPVLPGLGLQDIARGSHFAFAFFQFVT